MAGWQKGHPVANEIPIPLIPRGSLLEQVKEKDPRGTKWPRHVQRHESLLHDIIQGRMTEKARRSRKRMHLLSDRMKGSMWHSKEQLKTGKSGRNCQQLEVIHLLLSRLLEEEEVVVAVVVTSSVTWWRHSLVDTASDTSNVKLSTEEMVSLGGIASGGEAVRADRLSSSSEMLRSEPSTLSDSRAKRRFFSGVTKSTGHHATTSSQVTDLCSTHNKNLIHRRQQNAL